MGACRPLGLAGEVVWVWDKKPAKRHSSPPPLLGGPAGIEPATSGRFSVLDCSPDPVLYPLSYETLNILDGLGATSDSLPEAAISNYGRAFSVLNGDLLGVLDYEQFHRPPTCFEPEPKLFL